MIKVKTVDSVISFLVSLCVTYPAIALAAILIIYSYAPGNSLGLKTIPAEIYTWIESQKHTDTPDGYLKFSKCLDDPSNINKTREIKPCQNWGNEAVSVSDASTMAINAIFMLYMGLLAGGAFIMFAVKLTCGGLKSMLTPMYELFKELAVTIVTLVRRKSR